MGKVNLQKFEIIMTWKGLLLKNRKTVLFEFFSVSFCPFSFLSFGILLRSFVIPIAAVAPIGLQFPLIRTSCNRFLFYICNDGQRQINKFLRLTSEFPVKFPREENAYLKIYYYVCKFIINLKF